LKAAGDMAAGGGSADFLKASARLFAREAAEKVYVNSLKVIHGSDAGPAFDVPELGQFHPDKILSGMFSDMRLIADELRR